MRRRRLAGLVLVPAGALVLGVIEPALTPTVVHAGPARIEPGTAAATASVLGISPAVSGLQLSASIGKSTAAYQHTETQAKSGTLDLGALGLVLANTQFCGRSSLPSEDQPHPIAAYSEDGEQHRTRGTKGFGQESVTVVPDPESASATTTTIDQRLPGVVSIRGRSHAAVRYVEGRRQVATSSVTEDISLLGGQVRFEGMRWTARRISGATQTRDTDFSFGRVSIGGVPLESPDSAPGATIKAINTVLAPIGLSVREPVRSRNEHSGAVAIGPFTLRFSGSSIERSAFGPLADGFVTFENLLKSLGRSGDNCAELRQLIFNLNNNSGTLAHVVLAIAQGAGALDLQFGGVAAAAQNPAVFDNPFGQGDLPSAPPGVGLGGDRGTPRAPASRPPGSVVRSGGPATSAPPVVTTASERCVSTSPSSAHGCWHGLATVASTGALAVGIALLITDAVVTRRRRTAAVPIDSRSADASE